MTEHDEKYPGTNVVVVGAGIVGASVAYHLCCQGAQVTIVEAGHVASGVTSTSFAWINTAYSDTDPAAALRAAAVSDYRRLEAQLPSLLIQWTGSLTYGLPEVAAAPATDTGISTVSRAQILTLEPNLKHPPAQANHAPEEGALNAVAATRALIKGAQARGARLLEQTQVEGFTGSAENVSGVKTTQGVIDADLVVIAAGTGTTLLTDLLGYPLALEASPAIYIRYHSPPHLVRGIISNAAMEVRHADDGSLLAAEDYLDDAADNQPGAIALRTAEAIGAELHGAVSLDVEKACVGFRPIPSDGAPLVGYLPGINGVYVCVMHPGVTLAATVGRLVSMEITSGTPSPDLAPCRLGRFSR
ncbi:FAD-binding oxidoreductase [Pseudomonas soli]|uniref:FAD-binding oxidoreductase n=1 Tax=Pseudomonas soli TaxID=1306993 RepID=A0A2V4I4L6_9PSED|nr:FAD-binding oxidoreductase [Pseudomonas soli]